MPGIKKTLENPPVGLQKAIISRSKGSSWTEAKEEWYEDKYYHCSEYKCCPCGTSKIRYITVMVNKETNEELEICNSCAEQHFNLDLSRKIKFMLKKVNKHENKKLDGWVGYYLFQNKVIDVKTLKSLFTPLNDQNKDFVIPFRLNINKLLINFTDYRNKEFFDMIDMALVCAKKDPNIDIRKFFDARIDVLNGKQANMDIFNSLHISYNDDYKKYTSKEKEEAKKLLIDYVKGYWLSFYPPEPEEKPIDPLLVAQYSQFDWFPKPGSKSYFDTIIDDWD